MEKKSRINAYVLLLMLFAALLPTINLELAKADKVSVQWGCIVPPPGGQAPSGEADAERWICDQIYCMFRDYSSFGYSNAWGNYTTDSNVHMVLEYCQNPYNYVDWATTWWVGDFVPDLEAGSPPHHRGFYGYDAYHIWDYAVYAYANYVDLGWPYFWQNIPSKQYFNFIWTCANGGLYFNSYGDTWNVTGITIFDSSATKPTYTPPDNFTDYGAILEEREPFDIICGMPFALTGTLDMSTSGYSSPDGGSYCYIGFENISPWMVDEARLYTQYKWFPYHFYRYALGIVDGTHHNIIDCLNYATRQIFGSQYRFSNTTLYNGDWKFQDFEGDNFDGWWYCRMRVFGNGALTLPN